MKEAHRSPSLPARIFYYDVIRVVAVLGIILVHVSGLFVKYSVFPFDSANYILGNFSDAFARFGIPLFVMLSGALMLDEKRDGSAGAMLRRAGRIFVLLYLWSFFYAVVFVVIKPWILHLPVTFKAFCRAFLLGHYHLWFLFMLLGLYLITPVLKTFVKRTNWKIILYFLSLSIVFRFLVPIPNYLMNRLTAGSITSTDLPVLYAGLYRMGFAGEYVAYYLLGWLLTTFEIPEKYRRILYAAGILGFLTAVLGRQITGNGLFYAEQSIHILCYGAAVFVFLQQHFRVAGSERAARNLAVFSNLAFGVYIIHPFFLSTLFALFGADRAWLQIPVYFAAVSLLSFTAVFVMSKIPLVKKLVRF